MPTDAQNQTDQLHRERTVRIPSQYPTLQAAVNAYSRRGIAPGGQVTLLIESGHRLTSGLSVTDGDYSGFVIKAEDQLVQVAEDFTGDLVRAEHAQAPMLSCLIDMADRGGEGYYILSSQGYVSQECGVMNAPARGLYVGNASSCHANGAIFTGSSDRNCWVSRASRLSAENADFSANKGGDNAVYVSRASHATLEYAKVTDAFRNAIVSTRSWVTATGVDVSHAGGKGLLAERAGHIQAQYAIASSCASDGIYASRISVVLAHEATSTDNGENGVMAWESSTIDATGSTVQGNAGGDLRCLDGSFVNARDVTTTTGSPAIEDTNTPEFNTLTPDGVIWA